MGETGSKKDICFAPIARFIPLSGRLSGLGSVFKVQTTLTRGFFSGLLEEAEAPRRLLYCLHRNPLRTMRDLIKQHAVRRATLTSATGSSQLGDV